jgi:branched-chain amino acid transport system substrate-binding protein
MVTKRFAIITMAVVLLTGFFLQACPKHETIRIGFVGGLTGRNGDLGTAGRDGALLAVEAINADGGINGKKIELVIRDDKSDPEEAKKVVSELVAAKVAAIVGPMTSVVAVATIPIMDAARTLMLSPSVSSNDLTGKDDFFVRLNLNRDTAAATADQMVNKLKIKNAALVYDVSNRSYTGSLAEAFKIRFAALGGTIAIEQTFNAKEKGNLLTLARKVAARNPRAVFIMAGAIDSAMICQQLKKVGMTAPFFISEWASTNEFLKAGGKAVAGTYSLQHFNGNSIHPPFVTFKRDYSKRFGDNPSFAATYSYEAVSIIAAALRKDPDPARLKDTIIGIGKFDGLLGSFFIDRYGDPERLFYVMHVRNDQYIPVE